MFGPKKVEVLHQRATGQLLRKMGLPYKLKMDYTLKVLLFTDVDKKDPDKDMEAENNLDEEGKRKYKKRLSKKYPKHRRFWAGA